MVSFLVFVAFLVAVGVISGKITSDKIVGWRTELAALLGVAAAYVESAYAILGPVLDKLLGAGKGAWIAAVPVLVKQIVGWLGEPRRRA